MIDLTKFKAKNPNKRLLGTFTDAELDAQKGKLPDAIIDFLKQEGECTYNDDFLWTVLPKDFHEVLTDWGLEGANCFVFMRSSLGSLLYFYDKNFYVFNPVLGTISCLMNRSDILFNNYLCAPLIVNSEFWRMVHLEKRNQLPDLQEDEMYAFIPTIPEGGSPETSKVEVVNMKQHLASLAELYEHSVTEE